VAIVGIIGGSHHWDGVCVCVQRARGALLRKRLQGKQPCHTHHLFINRLLVVRRFSKMVLCFKR
jgi:hypothetical protein